MCCGSRGYSQYPDRFGQMVSELKPGDVVIVTFETGDPPVRTVIAAVHGYSALTAEGRKIGCGLDELVVTGLHQEKYSISEKAYTIMLDLGIKMDEASCLRSQELDFDLGLE